MKKVMYFCSAELNGKIVDTRMLHDEYSLRVYMAEQRSRGRSVEVFHIDSEDNIAKCDVAYIPPPSWLTRVVCVETGWIFTSISVAAKQMGGSHWGLRKAIIRNTIYKGYHWRMYGDKPQATHKFK